MRQYRCWIRNGFETSLYSIVMILVFSAISLFSSGFDLSAAASSLPYFPILAGMMFNVIVINTSYVSYLPVYLSFGSTRTAAAYGLQLMSACIALGSTAITALTCLIPGEVGRSVLPLLPAVFFLQAAMGSFGHLVGCASVRWPKWGTALMFFSVFLVSGGGGGIGGYLSSGGALPALPTELPHLTWTLAAFCLAAVLFLVSLAAQKRLLRTYEVRL